MKLLRRMLFLLAVIMLLPVSVRAAENNSITVIHSREDVTPSGVVFTLYRVDSSAADPMEAYASAVQSDQKPIATAITDTQGKAVFADLAEGKYLLMGESYIAGDQVCDLDMSLVQLPADTGAEFSSDNVIIIPKYAMRDHSAETVYRVVIIWEDESATQWRPDAVAVQLFRNGGKHSQIKPDQRSNWQYSWTDTDPLASWVVLETVPENYQASYFRDGNTFVITNTLQSPADADPGTKLPQTGQLWWPVSIFAMTGCALILLGWFRRKESLDET